MSSIRQSQQTGGFVSISQEGTSIRGSNRQLDLMTFGNNVVIILWLDRQWMIVDSTSQFAQVGILCIAPFVPTHFILPTAHRRYPQPFLPIYVLGKRKLKHLKPSVTKINKLTLKVREELKIIFLKNSNLKKMKLVYVVICFDQKAESDIFLVLSAHFLLELRILFKSKLNLIK